MIEINARERRGIGSCQTQYKPVATLTRLPRAGVAPPLGNPRACPRGEAFGLGALGDRRPPLRRRPGRRLALGWAIVTLLGGQVDQWPTQRPLPPGLAQPENAP